VSNSQALTDVLTNMRAAAESERDKGTAFERLVKVFLERDARLRENGSTNWIRNLDNE